MLKAKSALQPDLAAQSFIQVCLGKSPRMETAQPLWATCPLFGCSHSERVSPYLHPKPLLFHLRPDASCILPRTAV